jgi:D-tyrosyl-tRNA(Tyr) deacylase
MRAVVQRVSRASVSIEGREAGRIGKGVVLLVGVAPGDSDAEARWLADKVANLRIFKDEDGNMNRSLLEIDGQALVISQFTLYGDARKGRRPSFVHAAQGRDAVARYEEVIRALEAAGVSCESGEFGAMMDVALVNTGPVTILLDSDKTF